MDGLIKSVGYDQQKILNDILRLYIPNGKFDLDTCYSKGIFYKDNVVPQPVIKMDISPQCDDVIQCDCRNTGLDDLSVDSIIFDPPFLATTGASLITPDSSNRINKRFGVYPDENSLWSMYQDSLNEFYRILKHKGVLVFKCQDKVSSGKQYIMHNKIINAAEDCGFVCEDIFILIARSRLVAEWQARSQKHARKFHSYFLVFKKK